MIRKLLTMTRIAQMYAMTRPNSPPLRSEYAAQIATAAIPRSQIPQSPHVVPEQTER